MKTKILALGLVIYIGFLGVGQTAFAGAFPLSGVTLFLKSIKSLQVISSNTDADGYFSNTVPETDGAYNLFIGDESLPPVKMTAKNGVITGRIVVLTDGTTTQDPAPAPVTITPAVKKVTPTVVKKTTPTTAKTKKTTPVKTTPKVTTKKK